MQIIDGEIQSILLEEEAEQCTLAQQVQHVAAARVNDRNPIRKVVYQDQSRDCGGHLVVFASTILLTAWCRLWSGLTAGPASPPGFSSLQSTSPPRSNSSTQQKLSHRHRRLLPGCLLGCYLVVC